jgi:hypothetical protein
MNKNHRSFTTRAMVVAVHGALLAMAAMPVAYAEEDPAVAELTQPKSTVEVGVTDVSHASAKAGEYNGLNKQGATSIVNFDVRGGGSYDTENTTRMRMKGTDLGLESSNLSVEFGQQGKFKINAGYDQLLRNRSDSYMTPYIGAGSSNVLTLPAGWLRPQINGSTGNPYGFSPDKINSQILTNGVLTNPTATNQTNSYAALNADLPAFHLVNLSTKRTKKEVGFSYNIDSQWEFAASSRSEDKVGFKPMSTVTARNTEIATTIADKIDTNTSQYNMSLAYVDEMKFFKAAYYGSIFKNNVNSMSWADWSSATPGTDFATMSSAPSNQFHQVSLNGGYNFDKNTKLVLNGAYGRNTQNDTYLSNGFGVSELSMGVPVTSANAVVVTKSFDAKLTMKPVKDWTLAAGYKLDDRNNLTAVHNYAFGDAGFQVNNGVPGAAFTLPTAASALYNTTMLGWTPNAGYYDPASGRILSPSNIEANRPYNKKLNQFNLDATYALAKGQSIRAGFDHQQIDRSCTGSWIDCMDADKTKENTLRLDWRATLSENMNVKLGLAKSKRTVDAYNENAFLALVPMAQYAPVGTNQNGSATANASANAGGYSLYQTMQMFGITAMGLNTGYLTDAQLQAMYPTATATQLAALKYYFGAGRTAASAAGANGTSVAANQNGYASRNRISELIGMRRYNMADRDRNNLKAGLDWNATEQLSLQGGVNYKKDSYGNSVYGLTDGKEWGLNLDAAFAASDTLTLSAFYNLENRVSTMANDAFGTNSDGTNVSASNGSNNSQVVISGVATGATQVVGGCYATVTDKNLNAKTDPCLKWSADMKDKVDTIGIVLKQNNLMANRLDVTGGLTFTRAKTDTAVHGGTYVQNPLLTNTAGQTSAVAFYYLRATDLPTITTDTIDLTLRGKYKLDKSSAVHVGYRYQHMKAVNFAYDGMQMTTVVGNTMPTNEAAPNYTVHTIGASYVYNF